MEQQIPQDTLREAAKSLNEAMIHDQFKSLIEELVLSSKELNLRIWLDEVYTDIGDESDKDGLDERS